MPEPFPVLCSKPFKPLVEREFSANQIYPLFYWRQVRQWERNDGEIRWSHTLVALSDIHTDVFTCFVCKRDIIPGCIASVVVTYYKHPLNARAQIERLTCRDCLFYGHSNLYYGPCLPEEVRSFIKSYECTGLCTVLHMTRQFS